MMKEISRKFLPMNKIEILYLLALFICCQLQAQKNSKPNVLLIYTDDHRYTGVHALGGEAVRTPNLDQLAFEGIAFTNAYLQGAFTGATCVPSRAMLLTGRNLFQLGGRQGREITQDHKTMGEAFMEAGYYAYHVGKWHQNTDVLARSFHSGAKLCGLPKYLTDQYRMPFSDWRADGKYQPENTYLLEYDNKGEVKRRPLTDGDKRGPTGTEKTGPHVSEVLADEVASFVQGYDKQETFFVYLAFPTPHDPRQAPDKYKALYPEERIALPPSYMPQHPFDNGHIVLRDELLDVWPRTKQIARKHLSDYYAIISHLDTQIGRVIDALKASGKYENTLIVMAGDSGLAVGNHGLLGKQSIYEEDGIHIPFILSGGFIEEKNRGKRVEALCYNYDIMPTICNITGIATPESVTGKSLVPVIQGKVDQIRDNMYYAYRQYQRAYRKADFKLIEYVRAPGYERFRGDHVAGSRVTQLFNISNDPWETLNLADFPEYSDQVAKMRKEMKATAIELGDSADEKRVNVDFWSYYDQ